MSRISALLAYTIVIPLAGCLLPPAPIFTDGGITGTGTEKDPISLAQAAPSDMKLRVYTSGDGGLTGTGAPDDPLRLTGSYIENRASDAGVQNASFNIAGTGAVGRAFTVGTNAGIGVAPLENYALHVFGNQWLGSRDGTIVNPKLQLGTNTGENQYAALEYQYNGGKGAERLLLHFQAAQDQFVITPAGNVGIGTTSPRYKLSVGDDLAVLSSSTTVAIGNVKGSAGVLMGQDSMNYAGIDYANNNLRLSVRSAGSLARGIEIQGSTGNVGIGTSKPDDKLQIDGGNIGVYQDQIGGGLVRMGGSTTRDGCMNGDCTCQQSQQGSITYDQTAGANNGHFYGCRGYGNNGGAGPCGKPFCWVQLDN